MNTKMGALILMGAFLTMAVTPLSAVAGRGGGHQGGGQASHTPNQVRQEVREQERLRDGSHANPAGGNQGAAEKKGNTYGPGDGTGNTGVGPKDGTGYGAPSQR
jgi:hypothetical protein